MIALGILAALIVGVILILAGLILKAWREHKDFQADTAQWQAEYDQWAESHGRTGRQSVGP
jgi:hypothetical protein